MRNNIAKKHKHDVYQRHYVLDVKSFLLYAFFFTFARNTFKNNSVWIFFRFEITRPARKKDVKYNSLNFSAGNPRV